MNVALKSSELYPEYLLMLMPHCSVGLAAGGSQNISQPLFNANFIG